MTKKLKSAFTLAGGQSPLLNLDFRKNAFTLAEVLITLSIIGIVAALTIPGLVKQYKDKEVVTKLRSTFNTLTNAIRLAEVENGPVSSWGINGLTEKTSLLVAEKLKPHLKIAEDCGIDDSTGRCIYNDRYKKLNGSQQENYAASDIYHAYKILVPNGAAIFWHGSGNEVYFMIDINGNKKPNTWGKDLFSFHINSNGVLVQSGAPNDNPGYTCNDTSDNGYGCTYHVLNEGNMDYLKK